MFKHLRRLQECAVFLISLHTRLQQEHPPVQDKPFTGLKCCPFLCCSLLASTVGLTLSTPAWGLNPPSGFPDVFLNTSWKIILFNRIPEARWWLMDYSMTTMQNANTDGKQKKEINKSSPSHSPSVMLHTRCRCGGWWPAEALGRATAEAGSIWHQFIFLSSRNQSSPSPVETLSMADTLVCIFRHYGQ